MLAVTMSVAMVKVPLRVSAEVVGFPSYFMISCTELSPPLSSRVYLLLRRHRLLPHLPPPPPLHLLLLLGPCSQLPLLRVLLKRLRVRPSGKMGIKLTNI